jgi:hypothetical protein
VTGTVDVPVPPRRNPYVGPRAFRAGEWLPGRDLEVRELSSMLVAERIVLLHSPSGAGKTSLIQAGVLPRLQRSGFVPKSPLRVNAPVPSRTTVHNRFVYSVALDVLARDTADVGLQLQGMTLPQVMAAAGCDKPDGRIPLLVFDQFEEILTLDPSAWDEQSVFFQELGQVLADGTVWTLLSMREDYMGGLDRFLRFLPGHLRSTYRLDFLTRDVARQVIREPARAQGIDFTDEAATLLVDRLSKIKVHRPCQDTHEVTAPYVEPFPLQVVCRQLWRSVRDHRGDDFGTIEASDVERHADVERALTGYYSQAVRQVARKTHARECDIRDWFETDLITAARFRTQTLSGPRSGDADPAAVVSALTDSYLIRGDTRVDTTWYELAHDRLIAPVVASNEAWRAEHLEQWRAAAFEWRRTKSPQWLLRGYELRAAQRQAMKIGANETERGFLDESARQAEQDTVLERARDAARRMSRLVVAQFLVIAVLVAWLLLLL